MTKTSRIERGSYFTPFEKGGSLRSRRGIFLSIAIILVCYCLPSVTLGANLPSTDVRLYRPFEVVKGQVTPVPKKTLKGKCWTHSLTNHRSDAWRCMVGNQIFDPCFVKTYVSRNKVICPQTPWSSEAVWLKLESNLLPEKNETLDMSTDYPWAVELLNGVRCTRATGAMPSFHGQSIQYTCNNDTFLVGKLQRCSPIWKALTFSSLSDKTLKKVDVAVVWY